MAEWQPIEKAPKTGGDAGDGPRIIVYDGDRVSFGYWRSDYQCWCVEDGGDPVQWMPVPHLPGSGIGERDVELRATDGLAVPASLGDESPRATIDIDADAWHDLTHSPYWIVHGGQETVGCAACSKGLVYAVECDGFCGGRCPQPCPFCHPRKVPMTSDTWFDNVYQKANIIAEAWTNDVRVTKAIDAACMRFGGNDGVFNAANFSAVYCSLTGARESLDGNTVRAILCKRKDVRELPGGSHFQWLTRAEDLDYDKLDPGIRDKVREIRKLGYETTDSGDGVSKPADYGGVLRFPHVVVVVNEDPIYHTSVLHDYVQSHFGADWVAEFSWIPGQPMVVLLHDTSGCGLDADTVDVGVP